MDELGRGTSPREGVGISHAIAEGLIALKVSKMQPFTYSIDGLDIISPLSFSQRESAHYSRLESVPDGVSPCRHFSELTKTLSRQPTVVKYVY